MRNPLAIYFVAIVVSVCFAFMKTCGLIAWTWAWVLSPIWIFVSLSFVCAIVALAVVKNRENKADIKVEVA